MNTEMILIENSLLIAHQMIDGNYMQMDLVYNEKIERAVHIVLFALPCFEFEPHNN
jgi:hypothetical protein